MLANLSNYTSCKDLYMCRNQLRHKRLRIGNQIKRFLKRFLIGTSSLLHQYFLWSGRSSIASLWPNQKYVKLKYTTICPSPGKAQVFHKSPILHRTQPKSALEGTLFLHSLALSLTSQAKLDTYNYNTTQHFAHPKCIWPLVRAYKSHTQITNDWFTIILSRSI